MVIDAFLACLFNVHYLIFLSMVHEYAFFMNIFGNRSIALKETLYCLSEMALIWLTEMFKIS